MTPPRVFLDTCHLSGMLCAQRGDSVPNDRDGCRTAAYQTLNSWLREGIFSPVWCELLVAEWIRHEDPERARRYARILDSAPQVLEFDPGVAVPQAECLNECRRIQPELQFPQFEILRPIALIRQLLVFMNQHHPNAKEAASSMEMQMPQGPQPQGTVRMFVEAYICVSPAASSVWEVGVKGDKFAFDTTKATQQSCSPEKLFLPATIKNWVLNALRLKDMLASVNPDCNPEDIVERIDISKCPGLCFYYRFYHNFVRNKKAYDDPHDLIDHAFIPGLCYCDHALVDKRVRDLIEQVQRDGAGREVTAASDPRNLVSAVSALLNDSVV